MYFLYQWYQQTEFPCGTSEVSESKKCEECEKYQSTIEKMQTDLQKAAKLRNEMEEEWCRISQDLQVDTDIHSSLMMLLSEHLLRCLGKQSVPFLLFFEFRQKSPR